ncbi:MAG: SGNH/GDSL hydrolase family protein [Marivirga sp.]|nr:SGNH/GDSL hydrolase family protein [Marivirga sp.]
MKRVNFLIILCFTLGACAEPQITWVAIGDSITYLNDHLEETGSRVTKGYMTSVVEKKPFIKYTNKGYNGWTARGIANEIDSLGLTSADIYSVFLGTNDWWQGRPVGTIDDYKNNTGSSTFYGSFRRIIDKLKMLNKDAKVILITPMQRGDFVYLGDMNNNAYGSYKAKDGQMLKAFADAVIAIGDLEKIEVIDLYAKSGMTLENMVKYKRLKDPATGLYKNYTYPDFLEVPFHPATDEYPYPIDAIAMTYDGLHPSDGGYKIISSMILEVLDK